MRAENDIRLLQSRGRARARAMCVRARPYIFRFGGYIARQLEVNNERSCPKNYLKKNYVPDGVSSVDAFFCA